MTNTLGKNLFLLFAPLLFGVACRADSHIVPPADSGGIDAVLSWLPADTETVIAANGPFWMSDFQLSEKEEQEPSISVPNLGKAFQSLTLALFNLRKSSLEKHLERQKLLLAVEGSRHFRPAAGLGSFLFEGCAIAIFADDVSDRGASFMNDASKVAQRIEEIDGQKVAVFQDRMEEDLWTSFVVFPSKNVVIVSTNEAYLREVLSRMRGKSGPRALSETLLEWKFVNKRSQFWGLRHFDKSQSAEDQTSPFGGSKSANIPDEQAIGITFNCDPEKQRSATITYVSNNQNILKLISEHLLPSQSFAEGGAGLNARYRSIQSNAVQGSFELSITESVSLFLLVLMAQLGYAVNL